VLYVASASTTSAAPGNQPAARIASVPHVAAKYATREVRRRVRRDDHGAEMK
jgi:hypothetical protein